MTTITWTTFWITATAMLVSYYLIFGIYFYSGALKDLIRKPWKPDFRPLLAEDEEPEPTNDLLQQTPEEEDQLLNKDISDRVELLVEQLKDGVARASENEDQPTVFKAHLSGILKEFPDIRDSEFRPAINEFLIKECKTYGSIAISEDDAEQLW